MSSGIIKVQWWLLGFMVVNIAIYKFFNTPFILLAGTSAVSQLGLLILAMVGLIGLVASLLKGNVSAMKTGGLAIAVGFLPVIVMIVMVGGGYKAPRIHDVSTDLDDVPVFIEAPKYRKVTDNSLVIDLDTVAQQKQRYPDLVPLLLDVPTSTAYGYALEAVNVLGWSVLRNDANAGELEAVDESLVFGFEDDVIIRVRPAAGGSRIDARSASRVGRSDLGANANRIRKLFERIQGQIRP